MQLPNALAFSHTLVEQTVQDGDTVIDGTVGQGNDTRFLAARVGPTGHVLGFDIQQQALDETAVMLTLTGLASRVTLIHDGHQNIDQHMDDDAVISAAMFNLGYLPGGDHQIVTHGATTVAALTTCCHRLRSGGIITIVVYTGHDGGLQEADTVESFVDALPQAEYQVLQYRFTNQQHTPPYLIAVQKR